MGKHTLVAVGGGGLSGLAVLAIMFGAPGGVFFAYIAALPLLLLGFSLGSNAAAIAASVGLALVALFGGVTVAGVYAGMHALPSWLVVHQALSRTLAPGPRPATSIGWYPIGTILASLAGIAALVATSTAIAGGGEAGIEGAVRDVLTMALHAAAPNLPEADRDMLTQSLAALFIGFSAVTWQLMIVINAVIAQMLLSRHGRAIRPTPAWSDIRLPEWLSWLIVTCAAVALVGSGDVAYLARNLVVCLAVPFFFVGLSVVHGLAARTGARGIFLVVFYLGLGLFLVIVGTLVVALGMLAEWTGRRPGNAGPPRPDME
jgi:Predicted membrane protein (DUF2232)